MDQLQTRLDALEQQMHTVNRRLRWWRGLAGGLVVLAVLTWALPVVTADDAQHDDKKGLAQRVAALEDLLKHFSRKGNEVFITGANLHLVNGLGLTGCTGALEEPIPDCPNPNGLGNLIVGYNEPRGDVAEKNIRTGSHNVVVGQHHNFSRFGGLVVGFANEISGDFASVSGGRGSTASGDFASVSGGSSNTASGDASSVSGGASNTASGEGATVTGGNDNTASGPDSSVSGGDVNTASGFRATVTSGANNTASGPFATVSGGGGNTASGDASSVSGGHNRTAEGEFDWVAGSLLEDE
jgi:hypothetical protein